MLPGVDFSEFLIVCVVALVVLGPRDLPKLARTLAGYLRQARGLAREFQKNFDEMGRALELDELRKEVEALKRGDPVKDVTNEIRALESDIRAIDKPALAPPSRPAVAGSTPSPTGHPAALASPAPGTDAHPPPTAPTPPAATPASAASDDAEGEAPREERKRSGT
jgi:sec-independent protein translocase protein TatB